MQTVRYGAAVHPIAVLVSISMAVALAAPTAARADDEAAGGGDDAKEQGVGAIEEAQEELPPVEVSGHRLRFAPYTVPMDAPASRDVYGPAIIKRSPAVDANGLVQLIPGVSSRPYNGGEAGAPSFSIRGLPDDGLTEYLLVLIDGVPAAPLPYGWSAFSFLPVTPERISALDISRGGHTVRHSPNTVGGVLDILTDPIPESGEGRIKMTFGSNGYRSTVLSAGGWDGGLGTLVTVVDKEGDGYRDDGEFDIQELAAKLEIRGSDDHWIRANVSYLEDKHRAPGGLTPLEYEDDRFANTRPVNRFNGYRTLVSLAGHDALDRHTWMEAYGSYSYTARRLHREPAGVVPAAVDDWEDESIVIITGMRGSTRFEALGVRHELVGGLRYQRESLPQWRITRTPYDTGVATERQDRSYALEAYSVHVDDTFRPCEGLMVVLGLRGEHVDASGRESIEFGTQNFDDSFTDLLPAASASYELNDHATLFANWQQSFRPPQVWGFNFTDTDQSLDFEMGESAEAGVRLDSGKGLSGTISAWRVDFDDVATFDLGYYQNYGRIVAEGVDLTALLDARDLHESLAGLTFFFNWTFQESELREGDYRGNTVPYAWKDKGAMGASFETGDGWTFTVENTYMGPTYSDEAHSDEDVTGFLGRNRSVSMWNARVAKEIRLSESAVADLGFGVTNVLDVERYVHARGGFFGGGRVAYAPRQYFLSAGVTLEF